MYRDDDSSGNLLQVDWAKLSVLSANSQESEMPEEMVSPEQQALNDLANEQPATEPNQVIPETDQ